MRNLKNILFKYILFFKNLTVNNYLANLVVFLGIECRYIPIYYLSYLIANREGPSTFKKKPIRARREIRRDIILTFGKTLFFVKVHSKIMNLIIFTLVKL